MADNKQVTFTKHDMNVNIELHHLSAILQLFKATPGLVLEHLKTDLTAENHSITFEVLN